MSLVSAPAGDVTLMFTDIEGSTRAWETHGNRFRDALQRHDEAIRDAIAAACGYEVKTAGDSFMVAFSDPFSAVQCALAIMRHLETADFTAVGGMRVRIGLHTAELEPLGGDYFGPSVNRANRICNAGHGGMILLSDETAQQVVNALPERADLQDLGLYRLKDLGAEQRLFQLTHPDLPARVYPPLRTLNALPHNLPALTSFVGRQQELTELDDLLRNQRARLVTLTGPGGIGKTRLAIQSAVDHLEHFPDGVRLVELASITDPEDVPAAIAFALDFQLSQNDSDAGTQVFAFLRERRCLLVLDNFEQVINAARFVSDMLQRCPHVVCLVTSRQLLQVAGEREFPVAPLDLPAENASLADAMNFASVRLFVERARNARPEFNLTQESVPAVVQICRRLEGIPLAVELTATLVRGLVPQEIVPRLTHRFDLLATRRRDLEPRQRSLRGAMDWSYELLTEDERGLFTQLAVFAGGCSLEDVEAVCTAPDALTLMFDLRDKSLLRTTELDGEVRYSMLEMLREYAFEKLAEQGELDTLRRRHAEYFLEKASQLAERIEKGDAGEAKQRLALDLDNLRAGMDWTMQQNELTMVAEYGRALGRFFLAHGLYREGDERLLRAETACRAGGDPHTLAKLLLQRGRIAFQRSDLKTARQLYTESYEISESLGDRARMVPPLINLGNIAWAETDFITARARYEEALELARATQQPRYEAVLIANLGLIVSEQGELEEAARYFAEGIALHRRSQNPEGLAYALMNYSDVLLRQNQYQAARESLEESLRIFQTLGSKNETALASIRLGMSLIEQKHAAQAQEFIEEGLRIAQEIGDSWCEMYGLAARGRVLGMQDQLEEALSLYRQSFALAEKTGDRKHMAEVLRHLGYTLHEHGQSEKAYCVLTVAYFTMHSLRLPVAEEVNTLRQEIRARLGETTMSQYSDLSRLTPAAILASV